MNVLWLRKRSHYSSRRVQAVAEALHQCERREAPEILFSADGNRLGVFIRGPLGKMFSVSKDVNWMKVVRENWVVIVNLDSLDFFDAPFWGVT